MNRGTITRGCPCCGKAGGGLTRRVFLAAAPGVLAAGEAAAALPAGAARALAALGPERRLSLAHTADDERWEGIYWREGA